MARGRKKTKKQAKKFLLAVIALVLAAVYPVQEQLTKETGGTVVSDGSTLEVHYLDIGQGDCTLVYSPDNGVILVDSGEADKAQTVINYLKSLGIETIDYCVVTHPHSDHVGAII